VILSKDKNIRRNQIEIAAVLKSGAPAFFLTSGSVTAGQMGRSFIAAMPQIHNILKRHRPPYIATISHGGIVRMFLTHADLIKRI